MTSHSRFSSLRHHTTCRTQDLIDWVPQSRVRPRVRSRHVSGVSYCAVVCRWCLLRLLLLLLLLCTCTAATADTNENSGMDQDTAASTSTSTTTTQLKLNCLAEGARGCRSDEDCCQDQDSGGQSQILQCVVSVIIEDTNDDDQQEDSTTLCLSPRSQSLNALSQDDQLQLLKNFFDNQAPYGARRSTAQVYELWKLHRHNFARLVKRMERKFEMVLVPYHNAEEEIPTNNVDNNINNNDNINYDNINCDNPPSQDQSKPKQPDIRPPTFATPTMQPKIGKINKKRHNGDIDDKPKDEL